VVFSQFNAVISLVSQNFTFEAAVMTHLMLQVGARHRGQLVPPNFILGKTRKDKSLVENKEFTLISA